MAFSTKQKNKGPASRANHSKSNNRVSIVRSDSTTGKKVLWVLLIIILPVLGLIIWGIMGPRGNRPDARGPYR